MGKGAFATAAEFKARYADFADHDDAAIAAELEDASTFIRSQCDVEGVDPDVLDWVCREVAYRHLVTGRSDLVGVSQATWSATPYSQSMTLANPGGDFYLSKSERRALGMENDFMRVASATPIGG